MQHVSIMKYFERIDYKVLVCIHLLLFDALFTENVVHLKSFTKCMEQQEEGGSRYSHNKVTQSPKQRQSDMFPSQHVLNTNTHNIHTLEFSNILR